MIYNNIAVGLMHRWSRNRDPTALARAMKFNEKALELRPDGDPERSVSQFHLSQCFLYAPSSPDNLHHSLSCL